MVAVLGKTYAPEHDAHYPKHDLRFAGGFPNRTCTMGHSNEYVTVKAGLQLQSGSMCEQSVHGRMFV